MYIVSRGALEGCDCEALPEFEFYAAGISACLLQSLDYFGPIIGSGNDNHVRM